MPELRHTQATKLLPDLSTMPKAELHLHLEGAPAWDVIREASSRYTGVILPEFPHFYKPEFKFADFGEFLRCFREYLYPWLQTPCGYAEVIQTVVANLIQQRIRYVELNFSLLTIERVGADLTVVMQHLETAVAQAQTQGTVLRIIAGIGRQEGVEKATVDVQRLLEFPIISGFDLHGAESPTTRAELFHEAFAPAREAGKKIKAHAGELDGPESIRSAVERLGVNQIGHGTTALQDPEVIKLLIEREVLVEMCPTSNERLQVISAYNQHPILALDAAGVLVTVNSDDPSWFGVNLTDEMGRLMSERGATVTDLGRWTRNAFQRAMVDEGTRSSWETELDDWLQQQTIT